MQDGWKTQEEKQEHVSKFDERAFSVADIIAWNDLPLHVRAVSNTLTHSTARCDRKRFCPISFYARKQLCFQRVLAIAILSVRPSVRPSVCLSVRHTGGSGKNVSKLGSPNLHHRLPGRL